MQYKQIVLVALLCSLACTLAAPPKLDLAAVASQLAQVERFLTKGKQAIANTHISDPSDSKCLLCGIFFNEVQGFLAENLTETAIEQFLKKDICDHLPTKFEGDCGMLIDLIPDAIDEINNGKSVSEICVDDDYCTVPFTTLPDPMGVPTYIVNLDLEPEQRWKEVCSNSTFQKVLGNLITALSDFFDNSTILSELGKTLNNHYFPSEFAGEIRGCAAAMNFDYGWLTMVNLGYEISDACTSIVAQTPSGQILHARNMDFWDGIWLTDHLKNLTMTVEFQKGGKTEFYATTFAGYVGVLSGMKPNGFSISIDTRYYTQGISQFFYEIIAAITEKNATLVSFLSRDTLTHENDFNSAINNLSGDLLIADVYYIVGGVSAGQGAVISRNRQNASDIWMLDSPSRWYEVQTNYDHWKQPPWFDDRVKPADTAMTALGQSNVTLDTIFTQVLSLKPVLNIQSTFTMLACPATGYYLSLIRNCPWPCSE